MGGGRVKVLKERHDGLKITADIPGEKIKRLSELGFAVRAKQCITLM